MAFVRRYRLSTAPDRVSDLLRAAATLVEALRPIAGFEDGLVFTQQGAPGVVYLDEVWCTQEAHAASATHVPKEQLKALVALLSTSPEQIDLDRVA